MVIYTPTSTRRSWYFIPPLPQEGHGNLYPQLPLVGHSNLYPPLPVEGHDTLYPHLHK